MNKPKDETVWRDLKNIDLNKEKINIFYNPAHFFSKFIEKISDKTIKKSIRIEIYLNLRKVSDLTHNPDDDTAIAKLCKNDLEFVNVCRQFYSYTLNLLNLILTEQVDTILDSYNEKKIDKTCMEDYIKVFKKAEKHFLKEKGELEKRIEELDILIEEAEKDSNLLDNNS